MWRGGRAPQQKRDPLCGYQPRKVFELSPPHPPIDRPYQQGMACKGCRVRRAARADGRRRAPGHRGGIAEAGRGPGVAEFPRPTSASEDPGEFLEAHGWRAARGRRCAGAGRARPVPHNQRLLLPGPHRGSR